MANMDWRERLAGMTKAERMDLSSEGLAVTRILKGLGVGRSAFGKTLKAYGIPYDEEQSSFDRAVSLFRAMCPDASLVSAVDVKSFKDARGLQEIVDMMLAEATSAIVFAREEGTQNMTALIAGQFLFYSKLGMLVIKPVAKYLACHDGLQIWELDPVKLVASFAEHARAPDV